LYRSKAITDINITQNTITSIEMAQTLLPQIPVKEITRPRKIRLRQNQFFQLAMEPMVHQALTA